MLFQPMDKLPLNNGATLLFTPCPGSKDVPLEQSVVQLKDAGSNAIITLMYDNDMANNGIQDLALLCKKHDLAWFQLPIYDDAAPNSDFLAAWQTHLADILAILKKQGTVAVHCKGGTGRTGLVIGLLMLELGYDKVTAKRLVQGIRSKSLVIPAQVTYFNEFNK
ncbi:tyrosine-protein phosphatase [Pseudoalteromonas mariniglutinosa]|uniref:phosphatase domain-containing putative toxin n=1 Tax=Pseudoalteromonas mariniglutinosa TaxID=206042 RepID=UPI00384DBD83